MPEKRKKKVNKIDTENFSTNYRGTTNKMSMHHTSERSNTCKHWINIAYWYQILHTSIGPAVLFWYQGSPKLEWSYLDNNNNNLKVHIEKKA